MKLSFCLAGHTPTHFTSTEHNVFLQMDSANLQTLNLDIIYPGVRFPNKMEPQNNQKSKFQIQFSFVS